jgi:hypothetical protein
VLAVVCIGLAYASVIQSFSWNQTSHYDLIQALAHGTAVIDPWAANTGDKACFPFTPGDKKFGPCQHGHSYSARAPGLALLTLPWYGVLSAVDGRHLARVMAAQRGDDEIIWMLGLWANVLPGVLLLLLVWRAAERLEPGYGAPAAITLGLGTLVCAMSTLLFSHVLGALLAFAAFVVLMRERDGPARPLLLGGAGLLVGIGLTVEYPTLFAGIVLGLYAVLRDGLGGRSRRWWRLVATRAASFGLGVAIGVVPLAVYNQLTFGSVTHVAYADIPHNQTGFFGIQAPSLTTAATLLLDSRGLLTLAPVLVMALVGLRLMYRRSRPEALAVGAVFLAYLIYNAGYFLPFGGGIMSARFMTTALPFLALPLALAFRRHPGPTLALAGASICVYMLATLTHPLVGYETETVVWTRLASQANFQPTVVSALGLGRGWGAATPFLVAAAVAIVLAAGVTRRLALTARSMLGGVAAVGVWALFAAFGPRALGLDMAALRQINDAGDASAIHEKLQPPFSLHPLFGLSVVGLLAGLVALGVGTLWARRAARARSPFPG